MFRGWGFLLGEIWILIVLAALLGLFVGWLVWGRRSGSANDADLARLRAELEACQRRARDSAARVARLEDDLSVARAASAAPIGAAPKRPTPPSADAAPEPAPEPAPELAPEATEGSDAPGPKAAGQAPAPGRKPPTLDAPRGGQPDDLKRIKGIGPKLEALLNRLGFWHFDQIASWGDEEIAWVDAHLENFKGRARRDDWVEQARRLAEEASRDAR